MSGGDNQERGLADPGVASAEEVARRRARARRTALFLAAIVIAIFIAFLVTGVTGRG